MIKAKRFDGVERRFDTVSEVVRWADSPDGLADWMQDGDYIDHRGIPGKCGELVVCSLGIETDARILWHREETT